MNRVLIALLFALIALELRALRTSKSTSSRVILDSRKKIALESLWYSPGKITSGLDTERRSGRSGLCSSRLYFKQRGIGDNREGTGSQKGSATKHYFKKKGEGEGDGNNREGGSEGGFFSRLKSYIPGLRRSPATKPEPEPELGYRFQIRLMKKNNTRDRRHIITRIMRYFPDIKWETACDIVDQAFQSEQGLSVVRVLNSRQSALELQDLLLRAAPPVRVEVFDTKSGEVVI